MSRQIVLDTETTGLNVDDGHRVIEIGGVEIVDRRITGQRFHQYFRPDREIEAGALEVHGISEEFLADKPAFEEVADELIAFIEGAELVIHNAPFDVGFLDREFSRLPRPRSVREMCAVLDTLALAREKHPGQRNSLDALCGRYAVDNSSRQLHGALLDAQILADVYLAMTGGQVTLDLASTSMSAAGIRDEPGTSTAPGQRAVRPGLRVVRASDAENLAHEQRLHAIEEASGGACLWRTLDP